MDKAQKETLIKGVLENQDVFKFESLMNVNHKPHPYTIGAQHVKYASEHHGGMLGEDTCKNVRCAHPKCYLSYEEHTSDLVCFLQLKRNCTNDEATAVLSQIIDRVGKTSFDGICFVDTKEKFRIS